MRMEVPGALSHSKAAEDCRTPKPSLFQGASNNAPASWSAAVLCRFRTVPAPDTSNRTRRTPRDPSDEVIGPAYAVVTLGQTLRPLRILAFCLLAPAFFAGCDRNGS